MTTKAKIVLARAEQRNLSWMGAAGSKRWRRKLVNMLIVSATQTFLFFSAVWWTIMHCNGVKCVASCNTMYQNYQDPSLPSGSDILRYVWTCRASAIYDMPINWRYIQKRCPALVIVLLRVIRVTSIVSCDAKKDFLTRRWPVFIWWAGEPH